MQLSNSDYKTILTYYKISSKKKSMKWIKKTAEDILANKLCRCIKKVKKSSKVSEKTSIAICKNSIFTKRNIKSSKFSCKKKYVLKNYKNRSYKLRKTRRSIFKRKSI